MSFVWFIKRANGIKQNLKFLGFLQRFGLISYNKKKILSKICCLNMKIVNEAKRHLKNET